MGSRQSRQLSIGVPPSDNKTCASIEWVRLDRGPFRGPVLTALPALTALLAAIGHIARIR
ncbi:hypothetical protein ADK52_09300 [Streptomyces sp. WM6372]|nr:hypothetical protein ADK52_09300 [Streptomyces sp. WM6372]